MSGTLSVAIAAFTLTGIVLTTVAVLAWWRSRSPRMGLLSLGFAWFAVAGVVSSIGLFREVDPVDLLVSQSALAALGLVTIYLAAAKR